MRVGVRSGNKDFDCISLVKRSIAGIMRSKDVLIFTVPPDIEIVIVVTEGSLSGRIRFSIGCFTEVKSVLFGSLAGRNMDCLKEDQEQT